MPCIDLQNILIIIKKMSQNYRMLKLEKMYGMPAKKFGVIIGKV